MAQRGECTVGGREASGDSVRDENEGDEREEKESFFYCFF